MTNPILELLTAGQNLIRDPQNWTTGYYARNKYNDEVDPHSERATCFCSLGALRRASGPDGPLQAAKVLLERAVEHFDRHASLPAYNDNHTHAEVMTMWDTAKELVNVSA